MKKMTVSKTNKDGELEYSESYNIRHTQHIDAYIGDVLSIAGPDQQEDIDSIYALKEGSYTIDIGSYYLDIDMTKR